MNKIAVLLTCHNRKSKTLNCLKALEKNNLPDKYTINTYLVDDGSTDGTTNAVINSFPNVNLIQGDGNLFWNQGMRLAWDTASKAQEYDFYIWLNDDTILHFDALQELFSCFKEAQNKIGQKVIITGACRSNEDSQEFSYGGRTESGAVIPNGQLQTCTYINGNAVLVPREAFNVLGNLSSDYTHGIGDYDYGLRAIQQGFKCYTTKTFIATCAPNKGVPAWCDPNIPLKKRWKHLHSPLGLNLKEYLLFRKRFWKHKWKIYALKAYSKAIFPKFYSQFSQLK